MNTIRLSLRALLISLAVFGSPVMALANTHLSCPATIEGEVSAQPVQPVQPAKPVRAKASKAKTEAAPESQSEETPVIVETPSVLMGLTDLSGVRIEVDELPLSIQDRKDPRFKDESLRLLNMLSNTLFFTAGDKLTRQKGELYLAEKIGADLSVEFIYGGDERAGDPTYRLQKIVLVKPNGTTSTMDSSPVDDGGTNLNRTSYIVANRPRTSGVDIKTFSSKEIKDLAQKSPDLDAFAKAKGEDNVDLIGFLQEAAPTLSAEDRSKVEAIQNKISSISVPLVIRGPLLDELVSWGNRLEVLTREEFQSTLQNKNFRTTALLARGRNTARIMMGIVRKQSLKYAILASVVLSATNGGSFIHHAYDSIVSGPGGPISTSSVTPEGATALVTLVRSLDPDPASARPVLASLPSRIHPETKHDRVKDLGELSNYISGLEKKEEKLGGAGQYYIGDAHLRFLQTKSFPLDGGKMKSADGSQPIAMVSVFDKAGIISLQAMTGKSDEIIPGVSTVVILRSSEPALYAKVLSKLQGGN